MHAPCGVPALPIVNLTPVVTVGPAVPAILSPRPEAAAPPQVIISFKECNFVSTDDNTTLFDLVFSVAMMRPDSGQNLASDLANSIVTSTVTRRIAVNNATLSDEAFCQVKPTFYMEDQAPKKTSDLAKRMRELAGIPHKDNFT